MPRTRRATLTALAVVVAALLVGVGALLALTRPSAGGPSTPTAVTSGPAAASARPAVTLPPLAAVPASPSPLTRYAAIAGSASWLLYAQTSRDDKVPVVGEAGPYPRNERYLLDSSGHRTAVPRDVAVSLLGDEPLLLKQSVPPRFEIGALPGNENAKTAMELRWSLPASGRSGTASLPPNSSIATFAPDDSWITSTTVGQGAEDTQFAPIERLTRTYPSGRRVDLGEPFPLGAPYTLMVSGSGLIAYSDAGDGGDYPPTGQIRFRPWTGGTWKTLDPGYRPQGEIECSAPSATAFFCHLAGPGDQDTYRTLLFRLPKGTTAELKPLTGPAADCAMASAPSAATDSAFLGIVGRYAHSGACTAGKLSSISPDGAVAFSTRVYDPFHAPVVAFGHIVVDEYREHRLLAVSTVAAEPRVLVGR